MKSESPVTQHSWRIFQPSFLLGKRPMSNVHRIALVLRLVSHMNRTFDQPSKESGKLAS